MTAENPEAFYVCINYKEAFAPREISGCSVCLNGDITDILPLLIRRELSELKSADES